MTLAFMLGESATRCCTLGYIWNWPCWDLLAAPVHTNNLHVGKPARWEVQKANLTTALKCILSSVLSSQNESSMLQYTASILQVPPLLIRQIPTLEQETLHSINSIVTSSWPCERHELTPCDTMRIWVTRTWDEDWMDKLGRCTVAAKVLRHWCTTTITMALRPLAYHMPITDRQMLPSRKLECSQSLRLVGPTFICVLKAGIHRHKLLRTFPKTD